MSVSATSYPDLDRNAKENSCRHVAKMASAFLVFMIFANSQAAAIDRTGVLFNSVSLACWIEDQKVIAVVNSTGKTLPAGTRLSVDAIRIPDGTHYKKTGTLGRTPSGAIIRMGAVPSSSCTAFARMPMPVLRTQ